MSELKTVGASTGQIGGGAKIQSAVSRLCLVTFVIPSSSTPSFVSLCGFCCLECPEEKSRLSCCSGSFTCACVQELDFCLISWAQAPALVTCHVTCTSRLEPCLEFTDFSFRIKGCIYTSTVHKGYKLCADSFFGACHCLSTQLSQCRLLSESSYSNKFVFAWESPSSVPLAPG